MRFSLLNVYSTDRDGLVTGTWVQDHIGILETAKMRAFDIMAANSGKIDVAVVRNLGPYPDRGPYQNLVRLA
jgi:hypothetical protein